VTQTQTAPLTDEMRQQIADQIAQIGIPDETTHLIVHRPDSDSAILLGLAGGQDEALIAAEDYATKVDGGEVTVVPIDQIRDLVTAGMAGDDQTVDEAAVDTPAEPPAADGIQAGPDPDTGRLFEVPRVQIDLDDNDPSVLKLAFSGSVELERADRTQAELFNRLRAGKTADLHLVGYVKSGPTKTHRRDRDGNVDAIVAQKAIVVTDIRLD
jgi:hypothetical protein